MLSSKKSLQQNKDFTPLLVLLTNNGPISTTISRSKTVRIFGGTPQ